MRTTGLRVFLALALGGAVVAHPASKSPVAGSDREKLIGAWHLVSLGETGKDGKFVEVPGLRGMLVYTRDGHMSVQIMYPEGQSELTNDYVLKGYEASFGSFDVDDNAHTLTHHVEASITPGLVGKHLTRAYQLSGARLVIRSTRPDEHWSVTWEHD